ncbi:MAG: hypothetical protein MK074_05670 [Phycisphaerales bacterium]|nr:hypothetical protein [Phycisphaerales bacterium]
MESSRHRWLKRKAALWLRRSEIPTGWGLMEFDAAGDARFRLEAPDL